MINLIQKFSISDLPSFVYLTQGTCPVAHEVTQHIITMPLHMYLTDEDVARIADIVNNFVK